MANRLLALLSAAVLAVAPSPRAALAEPLFNGRDLTGWHADVPAADRNPTTPPSFTVRDGMLVSLGSPGGHLMTDAIHQNYRLDIEYRFVDQPGNCGVLVHASTPRALYGMFPASIEVQMMHGNAGDFWCIAENIAVKDMASRRAGDPASWGGGPNHSRRILNLTDDSENPPGQWNRMVVECLDDRVRVWLNGDLVNDGFDCTATAGRIAIQAEGSEVEFRTLDLTPIRALSPAGPWTDRPADQPAPIQVFILAGQSNMEGKARVDVLRSQLNEPTLAETFAHLHEDGRFLDRPDVSINFLDRRGPLSVGFGSPGCIGPELEFGNALGDRFDEPVLLIKAAWGGRSLERDFRPPSAALPDDDALQAILRQTNERRRKDNLPDTTIDEIRDSFGSSYRAMLTEVRTVLDELDERFPHLAGREYEIAGFVWFQGWNDQYNGYEAHYESNLVHLIDDVRRDLRVPDLPVVIGVMGQNGSTPATGAMKAIQDAQLAVPRRPRFVGTVEAVRTDLLVDAAAEALYPNWRERQDEWDRVGSDHPYHYFGSPLWLGRIGRAMGDAMIRLIDEP